MACLLMMMEQDGFDEYLSMVGPKISDDFVDIARKMLTSVFGAKLVALKGFEYEDPRFGYPRWKLDALNRPKDRQTEAILA